MGQDSSNKDPLLLTKIVGTLCVAGLIFLFGRWGAEALTSRGEPDMHHGDSHAEEGHEELTQAYTIEVAANDAAAGEAEAGGMDVGALMNAADPAKGENVFKKCKACHSMEAGKNGTGPTLNGVVGRMAGTEAGFEYSDAMKNHGQEWTPEHLIAFLGDVKGTVPGTKMSFPGIKDEAQRADLVAYLMGSDFDPNNFSASAPAAEASTGEASEGTAEVAEAEEATETAAAPAAGDAVKGETVFKKCKACHSIEPGKNGTGPSLFGVVDRPIGSVEGFAYSDAMKNHGGNWDAATLNQFLGDVKGTVPGTKMSFAGIKKEDQRADLIAYLSTLK